MTAWQEINGVTLEPWEAKTLRNLSAAWVNGLHRSTKPDCPSPCDEPEHVEARIEAQFKAMRAAFAGLADSGNRAE